MAVVPFLNLKAQYQQIKDEVLAAIGEVLDTNRYVLGPAVESFEKSFCDYAQSPYALGVSSGTSALHLALLAAGVGPGDDVLTVPMTFVATVAAIRYTGARPVFVDVHPEHYTLDPAQLEKALTKNTKAIIPVHLYGQCADMDPILEFAEAHKLTVIEDAAQAHGAEYKGRRAGSMGDFGCFSFYPGKNLGAYGEAGLVTCKSEEHQRAVKMYRDWGAEKKYHHVLKGYNYRMDGIQGAVLGVKMNYIESWTELRRQHAAVYDEQLKGCGLVLPKEADERRHVYHIYAVRTQRRKALQEHLSAKDVQWGMHYPVPVHMLEAHSDLGCKQGDFPVSEAVASEELSLPMFPEMSAEELERVVSVVKSMGEE